VGNRSQSKWEVLDQKDNGSTRWLGNETWYVRYPDYPPDRVDDYSIQLGNDYVQVAGITDDRQAVLIIEDRVANGPSLQVLAGSIEAGQTAEEAAKEEFVDESGWNAKLVIPLGSQVPQTDRIVSRTEGNLGAKTCFMFLALGLSFRGQNLMETEKIKTILVPWDVAVQAAWTGDVIPEAGLSIEDCGSRLALLLADKTIRDKRLFE